MIAMRVGEESAGVLTGRTAVATLAKAMSDPTVPAASRVRAADAALGRLLQLRELATLEARLTALEEAAGLGIAQARQRFLQRDDVVTLAPDQAERPVQLGPIVPLAALNLSHLVGQGPVAAVEIGLDRFPLRLQPKPGAALAVGADPAGVIGIQGRN